MSKEISKLGDNLTEINVVNGVATVDDAAFYDNAPKGLTRESYTAHRQYESQYVAATQQAFGAAATAHADNHNTLTGSFDMGDGVVANHMLVKEETETGSNWSAVSEVERRLFTDETLLEVQSNVCAQLNKL